MKKFKKGDIAYIMSFTNPEVLSDGIIVYCIIGKITTEDKLKDWKQKQIFRKKPNIIYNEDWDSDNFPKEKTIYTNSLEYPRQVAWVSYSDLNKVKYEKWVYCDILEKNPKDFMNIIN